MTRVVVIATGGTIASESTGAGVVATRTAAHLLDTATITGVQVETIDLMTVGSYRMSLHHLRMVSDAVADLLDRTDDPVDGIVITHGTDTMEETAILLDLVHDDPRPVILTGAQRAGDAGDGDGPRNLTDAVRVAASPDTRDLGVLIVFGGRILPARGTRKVHTTALDAFRCTTGSRVGDVTDRAVTVAAVPRRPKPLPRPTADLDHTRVDLVETYPGADDTLIRAAVKAGATGIVIAGTGIGNANPTIVQTVNELVHNGIAVVLSTRVPEGPVCGVYGNGGGADLVAAGVPAASGLPATQLRILLALWLSQSRNESQSITSMIDTHADNKED
ncbi:asparaginase [Gordonia sp. HNM0687]|uniref:asparaginase n=1 Tax=Gordonia mangrovi TaxID=2665643 RepID=A0A6L7GNY6_9ACTN|nr:asparaginase [Gordonia mangrovi]MXP21322.1 asparaginase [Gordonia mangrovi]UVF80070.1 asparaginase [Gordonia mangrovi]